MASAGTTASSRSSDTSRAVAAAHAAPPIGDTSITAQAANLSPQERARISNRDLEAFQKTLGYSFNDAMLLDEALCHSSFSHEHGLFYNNERLEFLGDSVLSFVVARSLYKMYPDATEGELTRMRAELVRAESLSRRAENLKLPGLILHGRSLKNEALPRSVSADALEAVLGAICLDGGIAAAEKVIRRLFLREAEEQNTTLDPKSQLQFWLQSQEMPLPRYELLNVTGPSHAPLFNVRASVNGMESTATGSSRKKAEFAAAAALIRALAEEPGGNEKGNL